MTSPGTRVACVDVPALPLQLLIHAHPRWRGHPIAVVDDDSAQGKLLWVNDVARRMRVLPGMRYAAARALASKLRARVVSRPEIEHAVGELFTLLHDFSPRVEPYVDRPGVFWVDPSGLARLYGEPEQWCTTVYRAITARGFSASVIVGFHRYRSYAIARVHTGCWVVPSPRREASMAATVPLERLDVSPSLRDELLALGIESLGQFMTLPGPELAARFGDDAVRLHRLASDDAWNPLRPRALVDPIVSTIQLEPPETNHERLLFRIKPMLLELMEQLGERSQAMSALRMELSLDHAGNHGEQLEPAAPTLDTMQVLELVRLRLGSVHLAAGIEALTLEAEGVAADVRQLQLFRVQRRRDLDAGARALARVCASFGAGAVTTARVTAAHLPEAQFTWEPTTRLRIPRPTPVPVSSAERSSLGTGDEASAPSIPAPSIPAPSADPPVPLVRRLLPRPVPISGPARVPQDGWVVDRMRGSILRLDGPYRVSGGWWVRTVERDYYFAHTQRGDVLWIFYDRPRRRWFLHGLVD